jgi:hypothetical protein
MDRYVEIGSSGYIQSHYMPPDAAVQFYGVSSRNYTGGSVQTTFGFKVDLDVGGETSSFEHTNTSSGPTLDALNGHLVKGSSQGHYLLHVRYVSIPPF